MSLLERKHCEICSKPSAKYSCPKCGIAYCSLGCYRDTKHTGCTESFYKAQVEEEMHLQKADEQAKKQMYEIVQRFREQVDDDTAKISEIGFKDVDSDDDSDEDDDESSLENRFKGVNLDYSTEQTFEIWSRLTDREKEKFLEMIGKDDISEIISLWNPWWLTKSTKPIITEVGSEELDTIPAINDIGVPVQKLAKKVHPSVIFQIVHLSTAYVYMMRHTNGEPRGENLVASFRDMASVAPLLTSKAAEVYQSTQEVMTTAFCNIDIELSVQAKISLLSDMTAIFGTPRFVAAMMSDIYSLIKETISDTQNLKRNGLKRSAVQNAERRVYFLLSVVLQMLSDTTAWEFIKADIAMVQRRFESEERAFSSKNVDKQIKI